ncbi:MAG TPA: hypothetical protein PKW79_04900, partial [Rhabdochlamydiaceae bacterium]|nr:hypothetical protein [Rhabdochlamydiaceae bacterium]
GPFRAFVSLPNLGMVLLFRMRVALASIGLCLASAQIGKLSLYEPLSEFFVVDFASAGQG